MSCRRDNADRFADAIAPFERPAGQHHMSPLLGPDPYLGVRQKLAAKIIDGSEFDLRRQLAKLDLVTSSRAAATTIAENYEG